MRIVAASICLWQVWFCSNFVSLANQGLNPLPPSSYHLCVTKLDWGILVSGSDGTEVLRREYWSNKATHITADAPSEAELHPELWGHIRFHAEPAATHLDPTAKKGKDKGVDEVLNDLK